MRNLRFRSLSSQSFSCERGGRPVHRMRYRTAAVERLESRYLLDGAALTGEGESDGPLPDFELVDVNPASVSFQQPISPRDYMDGASAWYFGHAT